MNCMNLQEKLRRDLRRAGLLAAALLPFALLGVSPAQAVNTFYLQDSAGAVNPYMEDARALTSVLGSSTVVYNKTTLSGPVTPPTVPTQFTRNTGGNTVTWYSSPLSFVNITGDVYFNIYAKEFSALTNAALTAELLRADSAGNILSTIATLLPSRPELTTGMAVQSWSVTPNPTTLNNGDRLALRVYIDDGSAVTMAGGGVVSLSLGGPAGNSYVQLVENVTELQPAPLTPGVPEVFESALRVNWAGVAAEKGYLVEASTSADFTGIIFSSRTSSPALVSLTVSDPPLAANTAYSIRVGSLWNDGTTSYAETISTSTRIESPSALYADEVSSWSITASAYASTFTNLGAGISGVNVTTGTLYGAWNAGAGTWIDRANIAGGAVRRYGAAAAALGGKIYLIGGTDGFTPQSSVYEYDTAFNTWLMKGATLPSPRSGMAAAAVGGKVYAFGGYDSGNAPMSNVYEYDPVTDTLAVRKPMTTARGGLAAAALGGKVYLIGGEDSGGPTDKNEIYDPAANTWSSGQHLNAPRRHLAAAVLGNKIYAVGGYNSGDRNENEEYDPWADQWYSRRPLPRARRALAAAAIGGKLYAVSGFDGSYLPNNDVYDPPSDTWASQNPIPLPREGMAYAAVAGKLYLVGGYAPGNPGGVYLSSTTAYYPGVSKAFSGLQPSTQYFMRARARNQSGMETGDTVDFSVYTLAVATLPAGPVFSQVYGTSLTVNWASGSPAGGYNGPGTKYVVHASTKPDFSGELRYGETHDVTTYMFDWLKGNSTYYFRVQASNYDNVSDNYWMLLGSTRTAPASEGIAVSTMVPAAQNFSWARGMARDSRGTLYIAYPQLHNGRYRIFMSSSSDGGNSWTATPAPIETVGTVADQGYPALAVDSKDGLHLAWTSAGSPIGCLYSSAPYPGTNWTPYSTLKVGSYAEGPVNIAVDSKDGLHAVWSGRDCPGAGCYRVRYSSRAASAPWSVPAAVNDDGNQATFAALALDARDGVHIVLKRAMSPGTDTAPMIAYSSRTSATGWSPWTSVYNDAGRDQGEPTLTIEAGGTLFAAWSSADATYPDRQVKYSRMAPGASWSAYAYPQPTAGFPQLAPAAAADAIGDVYVLWSSSDAVTPAINLKGSVFNGYGWKDLDSITSEVSGQQVRAGGRWSGWRNNGGDINFYWSSYDGVSSTAALRVLHGQDVAMSPGWPKGSWTTPVGCGYTLNVEKETGNGDFLTIQGAVGAVPPELSTTTCVVVRDTQTYSEQVTVQRIKGGWEGHRLFLMSDPTFISSRPAVTPPFSAMAGFLILTDSVTLQGINVISTSGVSYGILASSEDVTVSSLSVVSSGSSIWTAGISVSSRSLVSYSTVSVQDAHGIWLRGWSSRAARDYVSNNSSTKHGLYLDGAQGSAVGDSYFYNQGGHGAYVYNTAFSGISYSTVSSANSSSRGIQYYASSSNTVTGCYVSNTGGVGLQFASGSEYNGVTQSTITNSSGGFPTLSLYGTNHNSVSGSYIYNQTGPAVIIDNANYCYVGQSRITGNIASLYALRINAASSNTVAGCEISNALGNAVNFESGADRNALLASTITAAADGKYGVYFNSAQDFNSVLDSYVQASTAVYSYASGPVMLRGSTLRSSWPKGVGLSVAAATKGLFLATSTVSGGAQGIAVYLAPNNSGKIELASDTVNGGGYGLMIGAQPSATVVISSLTFQSLAAGATAINFLGGQFVMELDRAAFDSLNIDVNVNGDSLDAGSLVRMTGASGPRYGAVYEKDSVNSAIVWDPVNAETVWPPEGYAGLSPAAPLRARVQAQSSAVQYYYQVDTMPTMTAPPYNYDQATAQSYYYGAYSGQDGSRYSAGDSYLGVSTATFVFYSTTPLLAQNAQYYWRVKARTPESGDYGPWSVIHSFFTGAPADPVVVNDLSVSGVTLSTPTGTGAVIDFVLKENNVSTGTTPGGGPYNTADWIFVKFSTSAGADGTWNHATLAPGGTVGGGGAITVAADGKGAFLDHSSVFTLWQSPVSLTWNYAADGVVSGSARVKVFAISMVRVPQGSFVYNAGAAGAATYNNYGGGAQAAVTSPGDLPAGADSGWPNGYNPFYIMRYELSQGLYADFLNSVHSSTAAVLYGGETTNGHGISYNGVNPYGMRYYAQDRFAAKNYLSTSDAWSFLSWAALRPMTEMEFEKAARDVGTDARVYPWGDTEPGTETYAPPNEHGSHSKYFMNYNSPGGKVLDVGRYMSGDVYRTPEQTGASPYGVADLAGNVYEHVLNCSYTAVPANGNGTTVWPANWPADNSTQKGLRGGNLNYGASNARVSARDYAGWTDSIRYYDIGGRGARGAE